jgi:hypothetical protein
MSENPTVITCDGCGADITYTGNSVDYRLSLNVQAMSSRGGVVTDMMISPPLDGSRHFCGLPCLYAWSDERKVA